MKRLGFVGLVLLASVALTAGEGHDWPQFRGVNRDGLSAESGLADGWPETGPKELWRVPLGEGYSSISIVGGRLYTMYATEVDGKSTEVAAAFNAADGKEVWRVPLGEEYENEFGDGPRSTPVVADGTVYVMDSHGNVAALGAKDGKEQWRISLTETFGSEVPRFGFSMSMLVDGKLLLVEGGGGEGKSYAALDRANGKTLWTVGDGGAGYNSPLKVDLDGEARYVYLAGGKLMCIDPDGKKVWDHDWPRGETHAMPVLTGKGRIFASGAEGVGAHLFQVDESGAEASVEKVWESPFMRTHFNAAVLHDGHLFGFDNATLKAISVADGKMAWAKRGLGKGSLIYADGMLFVLTDRGKLLLLRATGEGYEELGSVQALEGRCWTAPSLSNGVLYLRNHDEMVAYDVRG